MGNRMGSKTHIFFMVLLFLLVLFPANGATIIVDIDGGGDFTSIQEAIVSADDNDEIEVATGTYHEVIDFIGKAVRLYSSNGPKVTTIDGTGNYHVVQCISGEGPDTILEGFTITGGNADSEILSRGCGGGMYNEVSCNPTVTNCIFSNNLARIGGAGMFNYYDCSPTITSCTFINNSGCLQGGGIYNGESSNPTVINCTFNSNSAIYYGGGMCNSKCSPTVNRCIFSNNITNIDGGGMDNYYDSSPAVTGCTFIANSVIGSGGGMRNSRRSNPTVTDCTFIGNYADTNGGGMANIENCSPAVRGCGFYENTTSNGGGIYNDTSTDNPIMTSCIFCNNTADNGGGIFNNDSNPIVINCTFYSNSALIDGGGLFNNSTSSPIVTNSILWGNRPVEIFNAHFSFPVVTYSDIQGGWSGKSNIDADPLFVDAVSDNLNLSKDSPCIDTADSDALLPIPWSALDFDGKARYFDVVSIPDTGIGFLTFLDMGAYEYQCDWSEGDVNCDGLMDLKDLAILATHWLQGL